MKEIIKELLEKVKDNKKYKTLSDSFVIDEIKDYLKSNKNIKTTNNHQIKQAVKDIRARLHKAYSSFQTKKKTKRYQYLNPLNTNKLLSLTLSTKERLKDYKNLYKQIFRITGKPKTIIDLGAGLNPLSYPLMNLKKINYYSYDIDNEDIDFLNNYFKILKKEINGKADILDITKTKELSKLPKSDIIFLFKVLDVIDRKNHKNSEELITNLIKKTNHIVVSFATKTITRKSMNNPKRKWFELMLERLNLRFKIINLENEIFYVVRKPLN